MRGKKLEVEPRGGPAAEHRPSEHANRIHGFFLMHAVEELGEQLGKAFRCGSAVIVSKSGFLRQHG